MPPRYERPEVEPNTGETVEILVQGYGRYDPPDVPASEKNDWSGVSMTNTFAVLGGILVVAVLVFYFYTVVASIVAPNDD